MRFSDPSHLQRFKQQRHYPKIHDQIFWLAVELLDSNARIIDLCCHFGLLGQRLTDHGFTEVLGVEMLHDAIAAGKTAGVAIPLVPMRIDGDTLPTLTELIRRNGISAIVARRCLSEIFVRNHTTRPERDEAFAERFQDEVHRAGVREFIIQGRAPVARPTWPVPDVETEAALLAPTYVLREKRGQCAYLTA